MNVINYLSNAAIPIIILIIVGYGVAQKRKIFDDFLEGAKEGISVVLNIFPTLLGLFVAIGALRYSGVLDLIINIISPATNAINFSSELLPLAILRPISGSASMAVATNILEKCGVDSLIGNVASTIMGSTETTFYTIAIFTGCVKIKKIRFVLIAALCADLAGILASNYICQHLTNVM